MNTPHSMQAELARYNGGAGIDLEGWICGAGNFSLAVGYASIFNPQFIAFENYIFRADCDDKGNISPEYMHTIRQWEANNHPFSTEWVMNHLHIEDLHYLGCTDISADKLFFIGNALKEIYEAKLAHQFPNKLCEVKFYIPEDPKNYHEYQLSFWQKKHRAAFETIKHQTTG